MKTRAAETLDRIHIIKTVREKILNVGGISSLTKFDKEALARLVLVDNYAMTDVARATGIDSKRMSKYVVKYRRNMRILSGAGRPPALSTADKWEAKRFIKKDHL